MHHKHRQNFQNGKLNALKSIPVLRKIKNKMQLDKIHIEDLEYLKDLFEAEKCGAYPLFLNQIKQVFIGLDSITSQEIKEYSCICENKIIAKYLLQIWNEMYEKQVQILIF